MSMEIYLHIVKYGPICEVISLRGIYISCQAAVHTCASFCCTARSANGRTLTGSGTENDRPICVQGDKQSEWRGGCLGSMDVGTSSLVASERQSYGRPSRSQDGKKILVLGANDVPVMLDLPSLSNRIRISPPGDAGPDGLWSFQDMNWTADNQPIACWVRDTCLILAVYAAHDASLVSLHEISRTMLPVSQFTAAVCTEVAPRQPYVAVTYAERMGLQDVHAASMLNLKTGQVHRLAQISFLLEAPVACDWAPSGLAMVLRYQAGAEMVSNIWHAASASFLVDESMPDLDHTWSPTGDICALTRCSSIVTVLHITKAGIEVWDAPLGEQVPPPRARGDDIDDMFMQPSCSFTISPCSKAVIASGGIGPECIKLWRFMLQQGRCERVHLVSGPGKQPDSEEPCIRWYPCARHACVCAIQAGPCTIHIRHCAKAGFVASMPMPAGLGLVQELLWAPDGMHLAYCIDLDQAQHPVILNFHA